MGPPVEEPIGDDTSRLANIFGYLVAKIIADQNIKTPGRPTAETVAAYIDSQGPREARPVKNRDTIGRVAP